MCGGDNLDRIQPWSLLPKCYMYLLFISVQTDDDVNKPGFMFREVGGFGRLPGCDWLLLGPPWAPTWNQYSCWIFFLRSWLSSPRIPRGRSPHPPPTPPASPRPRDCSEGWPSLLAVLQLRRPVLVLEVNVNREDGEVEVHVNREVSQLHRPTAIDCSHSRPSCCCCRRLESRDDPSCK